MKPLRLLFLLCLANPVILTAQSDFRSGYVVNNNDDTLYGYIEYKGDMANARKCVFARDKNAEKQVFTPEQIKGYRFNDSKYFVTRTIKTGDTEELLFLEYLINGVVDMYYYRDDLGDHYFIDNGDGQIRALKNDVKEVYRNNTRYFKESKEYTGQLRYAFRESPIISSRVEDLKLNHKSLIRIARDYHNQVCPDEACIIYEKKEPVNVQKAGPLLGINILSLEVSHEIVTMHGELRNVHFDLNTYPLFGLFYKRNLPFINEKLFIEYQAAFGYTKYNSMHRDSNFVFNTIADYHIKMNIYSFKNTFSFRYEWALGKLRPTFNMGYYVDIKSIDYFCHIEAYYFSGYSYLNTDVTDSPFKILDSGLCAGIGTKRKISQKNELLIDFKYYRSEWIDLYAKANQFQLTIGWQF
jgi:hypothetical protein